MIPVARGGISSETDARRIPSGLVLASAVSSSYSVGRARWLTAPLRDHLRPAAGWASPPYHTPSFKTDATLRLRSVRTLRIPPNGNAGKQELAARKSCHIAVDAFNGPDTLPGRERNPDRFRCGWHAHRW